MKKIDQIVKFLEELMSYQSVFGNQKEIEKCLKLIEKKFSKYFFIKKYLFKDRPMLVLSNIKSKKVDFILAGHVDVVPAPKEKFLIQVKKDRLLGRGVFTLTPIISFMLILLFSLKSAVKREDQEFFHHTSWSFYPD